MYVALPVAHSISSGKPLCRSLKKALKSLMRRCSGWMRWLHRNSSSLALSTLGVVLSLFSSVARHSRRRHAAEDPVGTNEQRSLVDDRGKDRRLERSLLAPVLGEDVVDVDVLSKEQPQESR